MSKIAGVSGDPSRYRDNAIVTAFYNSDFPEAFYRVAYGASGEGALVPVLHQHVEDRRRFDRLTSDTFASNAAKVLPESGWAPRNTRDKIAYLIAAREWGDLVIIGPEAIEPLKKVILSSSDDPETRGALEALVQISGEDRTGRWLRSHRGHPEVERFLRGLTGGDRRTKENMEN